MQRLLLPHILNDPGKVCQAHQVGVRLQLQPRHARIDPPERQVCGVIAPICSRGKRELHTFETRSAGPPGGGAVPAKKNETVLFPFQIPSTARAHHWKKRELIFSFTRSDRWVDRERSCIADRTLQDRVNEHITSNRKRRIDQALCFADKSRFHSWRNTFNRRAFTFRSAVNVSSERKLRLKEITAHSWNNVPELQHLGPHSKRHRGRTRLERQNIGVDSPALDAQRIERKLYSPKPPVRKEEKIRGVFFWSEKIFEILSGYNVEPVAAVATSEYTVCLLQYDRCAALRARVFYLPALIAKVCRHNYYSTLSPEGCRIRNAGISPAALLP